MTKEVKAQFALERKRGYGEVFIDAINVKYNPREVFNREQLDLLKVSIEKEGLLKPLEVFIDKNKDVVLIGGERRFRVISELHKENKWKSNSIPCLILKIEDRIDQLVKSFISNENVKTTPVENSKVVKELHEAGLSFSEISERLGLYQANVSELFTLSKSDVKVKDALLNKEITKKDAIKIARSRSRTSGVDELIRLAKEKKSKNENKRVESAKKTKKIKNTLSDLSVEEELSMAIDFLKQKGFNRVVEMLKSI